MGLVTTQRLAHVGGILGSSGNLFTGLTFPLVICTLMTKTISETGDLTNTQTNHTEYTLLLIWSIVKPRASTSHLRFFDAMLIQDLLLLILIQRLRNINTIITQSVSISSVLHPWSFNLPLDSHSAWQSTVSSTERHKRFSHDFKTE